MDYLKGMASERRKQQAEWAFTLIIPAGCKINDELQTMVFGDRKEYVVDEGVNRYRDLCGTCQQALLLFLLYDLPCKSVFETHKDGRYHLHGKAISTAYELNLLRIAINETLGYAPGNLKIFDYRLYRNVGWDNYMQKDQPDCEGASQDELQDSDNEYIDGVKANVFKNYFSKR